MVEYLGFVPHPHTPEIRVPCFMTDVDALDSDEAAAREENLVTLADFRAAVVHCKHITSGDPKDPGELDTLTRMGFGADEIALYHDGRSHRDLPRFVHSHIHVAPRCAFTQGSTSAPE